jgi:hypothetical protein
MSAITDRARDFWDRISPRERNLAKGETKPIVDDAVAMMTTEPVPLPTYITNAAKKAKFELKSTITPRGAQPKGGFVTNSASLQVDKLDIGQVKDFLNALEGDSKVVAITKLELDRDFRDKDKLRLDLEVSTYSREAPKAGSDAGSAGSGKAR